MLDPISDTINEYIKDIIKYYYYKKPYIEPNYYIIITQYDKGPEEIIDNDNITYDICDINNTYSGMICLMKDIKKYIITRLINKDYIKIDYKIINKLTEKMYEVISNSDKNLKNNKYYIINDTSLIRALIEYNNDNEIIESEIRDWTEINEINEIRI